jgi:hypothetical protein
MRIDGRRTDGALHLSLGGGLSVILRGRQVSQAADVTVIANCGPWQETDNSLAARTAAARQMQQATTVPVERLKFVLAESFDDRRERVLAALRTRLGMPVGGYGGMAPVDDLWIPMNGLGQDWVVYCVGASYYGATYSIDEKSGAVIFETSPVPVSETWASRTKSGADFDAAVAGAEE